MSENNSYKEPQTDAAALEEEEIDLMALAAKLWKQRKRIIIWGIAGAIVGIVLGFSIPKTYTAGAVLSPEVNKRGNSNLSSMASLVGINLDNGYDAINFRLFPEIVASTPFIYELFDLQVRTKDGKIETDLLDYMENHQKKAWFSYVLQAPFQALGWFMSLFSKEEEPAEPAVLDPYNLPKKERAVVKYFADNIIVNMDSKTGKITLSLEMQDPYVVATVMNAVLENLKDYMSEYHTSKARQDVENLTVICNERREDYYEAQQRYADYVDANKGVVLQSAQAERERLQQEMTLAYNVYSQVAQQLENSRVQVQQDKPAYAVVSPVTVPLKKTAPSKFKYMVMFAFLAGVVICGWILTDDLRANFMNYFRKAE